MLSQVKGNNRKISRGQDCKWSSALESVCWVGRRLSR